jgi:hypothetical protein
VSERKPDTQSERLDAPNQQAVGLDPPWVEGTGGEPGASPEAEQQADAEQRSAKETPKGKSDKAKEEKSGR